MPLEVPGMGQEKDGAAGICPEKAAGAPLEKIWEFPNSPPGSFPEFSLRSEGLELGFFFGFVGVLSGLDWLNWEKELRGSACGVRKGRSKEILLRHSRPGKGFGAVPTPPGFGISSINQSWGLQGLGKHPGHVPAL